MAKVLSNLLVQGLSGKLGDQVVFRRLRDGRTIVCSKPDFSRRKLSKDQKAHHARVKEAAAYAKVASHSQPIYAQLAAGTMQNAYNVAFGDWFHPPVIHQVKIQKGKIAIEASDDVKVSAVKVKILNAKGTVLEKGAATPNDETWWSYTFQGTMEPPFQVEVEAYDLAGNVAKWVSG